MPRCKLADCPVAKDGRCLEGHGESCPNLIVEEVPLTSAANAPVPTRKRENESAFESLPSVSPLELAEARFFSRRGRAVVVALAGMPECGKTSLLARLHQMFQSGPVAGFDFAGSRSLPRFEELNWMATLESCEGRLKMIHSSAQFDNSFLQLTVRPSGGGSRTDVLMNDIAGETFKTAINSKSTCAGLCSLSRADHLAVLIDCAALASNQRNEHIVQAGDFLERVTQDGQCGSHTALHIVISQLDCIKDKISVVERLETDLRTRFRHLFGSMNFWRIAARPQDGSFPTMEIISKMFASWVQTTHRYPVPTLNQVPRANWARDFCRFGA